jgi:hypothetical protein
VVDTSALRQTGGDLTKGDWPSVRAAARLGVLTLHLPSPALQELVDLRQRDLEKLSRLEGDASRLRKQLFGSADADRPSTMSDAEIRVLARNYRKEVIAWFNETGSVLDEPRVSHAELVERILAKRRLVSHARAPIDISPHWWLRVGMGRS